MIADDSGKREEREDYGAVDDDMSALFELIPMATKGWCDGNVSSSEGGREQSNGHSSGMTEDSMGLQVLPAGNGDDEERSIGYMQWMGLREGF